MPGLNIDIFAAAETFASDPNRMQLTSQVATKSGGPTGGLMNLTYAYNASAGQMGAGTTAGNAGQLMSISGTIGGTAESAAYTYDNVGRLATSNQTSNGSSAQRRFAYDRWGNRTGMWDALSGGDHIQAISLEQSAGVPTNRIQAVSLYNNDDGAPNDGGYFDGADCNGNALMGAAGFLFGAYISFQTGPKGSVLVFAILSSVVLVLIVRFSIYTLLGQRRSRSEER